MGEVQGISPIITKITFMDRFLAARSPQSGATHG
jgi:hypothetical protein